MEKNSHDEEEDHEDKWTCRCGAASAFDGEETYHAKLGEVDSNSELLKRFGVGRALGVGIRGVESIDQVVTEGDVEKQQANCSES